MMSCSCVLLVKHKANLLRMKQELLLRGSSHVISAEEKKEIKVVVLLRGSVKYKLEGHR